MGVKPIFDIEPTFDIGFRRSPFVISPFVLSGEFGLLNVRVGLGGAETAAS